MRHSHFTYTLAWVIGSMMIIPGSIYKLYHVYQEVQQRRAQSYLCRIVQTGPQKEALKTSYFAELMGLCSDQPIALTSFNIQKAEEIVKKSPVIKEARLKLIKPDTVYIDYTARQPVAALLDFENVALDADLTPFPIAPFFSPKKLPGIYLGLKSFAWNTPLKDPRPRLALHVLKSLQNLSLHVKIVDVMNSCAPSLGKREIVIVLDEDGFSKYLRLTPKNFDQEIANYLQLRPNLPAEAQVIDLRVPHLGFIESITSNLHQFESDKVVQRTPSDK